MRGLAPMGTEGEGEDWRSAYLRTGRCASKRNKPLPGNRRPHQVRQACSQLS